MGEARDVAQRWFETAQQGDPTAVEAVLNEDIDFSTPGAQVHGVQEVAQFLSAFATGFPDASFEIRQWIESGDWVVAEGFYRGTHTGPLMTPMGEIPATGKSIELPFATVIQVRDGKLSVHRAYWDNATFMMQLGLMPPPPA
jgi:steroid delta-isomerase-like uncharacterized protein